MKSPCTAPSKMSRPRVLIVSEPGADGVFRHVEALVRFLIRKAVEVDLAYSNVRNSPELYALVEFVELHGGKTLNLQTGNRPDPRDAKALLLLWRLVRERRPGIIHAHSSKAGALVRPLRLLGVRRPIFYTPHAYYGMGSNSKTASLFNRIETLLGRIGTTIHLSKTEALFARHRIRILPKHQAIMHDGIDCQRFCPPTPHERRQLRRTLGIPEEALLLGTVARYCLQKDPVTLHTAVRGLLPAHESLWFLHVGRGELWRNVDAIGPPLPRILRNPSFHPIGNIYKVLNGFVLASHYEGFSLAALEALATGLPLILSRAPGNRDLDSLGLNAVFWTKAGNVADLSRAIEEWIAAAARTTNHREVALKHFKLDVCLERLMEQYRMASPSFRLT